MAGEENRRIFLNDRSLDLREGYRILMGGIPKLEDINRNMDKPRSTIDFVKHVLRKERISESAPTFYLSNADTDSYFSLSSPSTFGRCSP